MRNTYQYTRQEGETEENLLAALQSMISAETIKAETDVEKGCLILEDIYKQTSNTLALSNNLLIESVTSNLLFESMDYGPVIIADGLIKEMVTLGTGIVKITNDIPPIPGRFEADDIEARQNFVKRCAVRSQNMIESITAEIYNTVDHVVSVAGYENDTENIDVEGRPPKSVEIIVDGGNDEEIANIIYRKKANGIRAYGNITIDVADIFGNIHKIGFSRPDYVYVWLKVRLIGKQGKAMAPNYVQLTQNSILEDATGLQAGDGIFLQKFFNGIYHTVINISMIEIKAATTTVKSYIPIEEEYTASNVIVNYRQKALLDAARIEVVLDV